MKAGIIGTSYITEHHINAFKKNKISVELISSLRKKSNLLKQLTKKHNILNSFNNWKDAIKSIKNQKIKIDFILISGKYSFNKKILKACLKLKKKILIEKPIFHKSKSFNFLKKFKKQIFVGYNRTKFDNVIYLKNKLNNKKKLNCIVKIPEKNKKYFLQNSCHVISVIKYLFGNIKIIFKSSNYVIANNSKALISIHINFLNSDNFSIEIFDSKIRYLLSPIENLKIYNKNQIKKIGINRVYIPKIYKIKNENLKSKLKPGFDRQTKSFQKFLKTGRLQKENSIDFAKKIIYFSEKIFV
jgi:hypothetical protein